MNLIIKFSNSFLYYNRVVENMFYFLVCVKCFSAFKCLFYSAGASSKKIIFSLAKKKHPFCTPDRKITIKCQGKILSNR